MIGKIMSEAAHSIIGMLSAKPVGMQTNASNSDFGSLLRPAEKQLQSNGGRPEGDATEMAHIGGWEDSAVFAQHWEETNVPTIVNFGVGNMTFGQDKASQSVNPDQAASVEDLLSQSGLTVTTGAPGLATGEAADATTGVAPNLLARQSNAISHSGYQIDKVPEIGAADKTDVRLTGSNIETENSSDVVDGSPRRNDQASKLEDLQLQARTRDNAVADGTSSSGDKGLMKLHNLQSQISRDSADFAQFSANATKTGATELLAGQTAKLEADKAKADQILPGFKNGEQQESRTAFGPSSLGLSQNSLSSDAVEGAQKLSLAEGERAGTTKPDLQMAAKSFETLIEPQAVTSPAAQPIVRDATGKPGSFDLSAPQVAERLAAEITEVTASGGRKTFEINPRNLGRMEITFSTNGSTEIVEIQTENRAAKDIIVQNSQALQDILKSQGRDDLTFRVDVKESMLASTRPDGGQLAQQENRDARDQQPKSSQPGRMRSAPDNADEHDPASDNSRYA